MLDFEHLGKYRENNRIEAKKALGGLPHSIWETYSAFANTMGGIILLGVVEGADKTLQAVDLPDPERLIREFWTLLEQPGMVSANILSPQHVRIETVDDKRIVAITVPRAQRQDKPVYVEGNLLRGTYRRSGEGDYRCTAEEIEAMQRDAAFKTQDMKLLEQMQPDVLDYDSVACYRGRMLQQDPDHPWKALDNAEFLYKLGAVGRSEGGCLHPTAAGLLMFGTEREIRKEYPHYLLEYQQWPQPERIISNSGDWSGNVWDFYFRVYDRLVGALRLPPEMTAENSPLLAALREALINCLVNADYHGAGGLTIIKQPDSITISNPGGLRIDISEAVNGGVSDPRNELLVKMFGMIGVGRRMGSGLSGIYQLWRRQGWSAPVIEERFDPERISLVLSMSGPVEEVQEVPPRPYAADRLRESIINRLTVHAAASATELAAALQLEPAQIHALLRQMEAEGILVAEVGTARITYRLKS